MKTNDAYKVLFEAANDANLIISDGVFIECNRKATEMFACDKQTIIGKPPHFFSPEYQPCGKKSEKLAQEKIEAALQGTPQNFEWKHKRCDEAEFDAEVTLNKISIDDKIYIQAIVKDITERKKFEEALKKSEEKYRSLFEQAADGIFQFDANGKIIAANTSAEKLTGYSKKELLQMKVFDFFTEEELKREPIRFDLLSTGHILIKERELTRKDGDKCFLEMHTKMLPDGTFLSITRDITSRKKAETELKQSEERYIKLIHDLPMGVVIHSEGKVVFSNSSAAKIMEVPENMPVEGLNVMDFVHPEYKDLVTERIKKSLDKQVKSEPIEEVFITFTGKQIDVEVTALPVNYKGKPAILTVFADITKRKKTEKLLQESEAKYRTIFENSGTATLIIEEDTTISLVNSRFEQLIGLPKSEIEYQKSWTEFVVEEDLERMLNMHKQRRLKPESVPKSYEFRLKDAKGEIHDMYLFIDLIPGTTKSLASLLDITERKKTEKELQKSRTLLRTMIDSLPVWISALDKKANYIIANKYYSETFQIPLDKIEKMNASELFPMDNYKKHKQKFEECIKKKKSVEVYDELIFQNGEKKYIYGNYTPMFDSEKQIIGVTAVAFDITKQKIAENLLSESENLFRSTFENAPIGKCLTKTDGKICKVNHSFCKMLGYTQDELLKMSFKDIIHPDDVPESNNYIDEILLGNKNNTHIEKRYIKKDGSLIWAITSASVIKDSNNNPKLIIIQVLDITKQKIIEQELKEAKDKFQIIFDNGPDAILVTRIEDGYYIDSNKTFTKYTGYTPEELKGKTTLDINIWENPKDREKLVHEVQTKGYCHNLEVAVRNKNGTRRVIDMSAEIIFLQGKPHLLSISRDITERKNMEDILRQKNEELHNLIATKDRFFSILAHDVKDPLNTILGFSDILKENYEILTEQEKINYIKNIYLSTASLHKLIENLLEWAKSQTGKLNFNPETIDAEAIIKETVELLQYQAKIKQIKLFYDISENYNIYADSNMVKTILRNLVANSIKYTKRTGYVRISAKKSINPENQNSFIEISVEDNGIGMKKEQVENLFKLDKKTKTLGTEAETGSGLGLILCKELVEKNNGYIKIESTENLGSVFTVGLPEKTDVL